MPSRIAVIPASTQAGRHTIRNLLESEEKPSVRGFYRDPAKAPAEFTANPRFTAVKADVGAGTGLDFTDSEAIFYIPPPPFDGTDVETFATRASTSIANAIKEAPSVKRLLVHSALAAQYEHSTGILHLNHVTDELLKSAAPEVTIIRPCLYYQMWADALKEMQADPPAFESPVHPADWAIPMVSVKDIASWSAKTLLDKSTHSGLRIFKMFGPRFISSNDLKKAIESVTGKEGTMTTVPPEKQAEFWAKIMPEAYIEDFVSYQTCQLPGGIAVQDYVYDENTIKAERELVDDLKEMVSA